MPPQAYQQAEASSAPVRRGSSRGAATLITAAAQLATPLAAAVLGVYIAREFRTGPSTDAFFFANAVYGVVTFVGASLRTIAVTGLMRGGVLDRERLRAHARAVGIMAIAAIAVFALLWLFLVPVMLPTEARGTARACVAILLPAALLQLAGGLLAAALATNDDFSTAAFAYIGAAVVTIVAAVLLRPALGVEAMPTAMTLGGLVSSLAMLWRLRSYFRHTPREATQAVAGESSTSSARELFLRLVTGAAATIAPQIVVSVTVVFAARGVTGDSTVMSYGQTAIVMLTTLLATPVMTVYAPVVAREHRHDVRALLGLSDRAFRAGAVMTPVAVAALCLLAPAPARAVLSRMDHQQVSELFRVALIASPCLLLSQALVIPMLGVVTNERFVARAVATLAVATGHVVLCAVVVTVTSHVLTGLASALVLSSLALALVDFWLAFGRLAAQAVRAAAVVALSISGVGAAIYAVAAIVFAPGGRFLTGLLTFALGSAIYLIWLLIRHRDELLDLVHSVHPIRA